MGEFDREDDDQYNNSFNENGYYDESTKEESNEIINEGESDDNFEAIIICEECDNRWYDLIFSEDDEDEIYCPLCGSKRVTII